MNHDVFISYSTENQNTSDLILKTLESNGIKCWIATRDIPPGENYAHSIIKAIVNSKVMIVVFSKAANISPYVLKEVDRAIHYNVTIIPFRIENLVPTNSLEFYLSTVEWLNAWTPPVQKHIDTLIEKVRSIIQHSTTIKDVKPEVPLTAKQKRAFDLAYDPKLREKAKMTHSSFWLGTRYFPGEIHYNMACKQTAEHEQLIKNALFSDFNEYEVRLGLSNSFENNFEHIHKEKDPGKKSAIRARFLDNIYVDLEKKYGFSIAGWWSLGSSISILWYFIRIKDKNKVLNSFNSIETILGILPVPQMLAQEWKSKKNSQELLNHPQELDRWLLNWIAKMEMFLLIEYHEFSKENAEILIELNPILATYILVQYLSKHPADEEAFKMVGKSSLKTFSEHISLSPLYRIDAVKILSWSMKKTIQINPDSDWSKRAQILLKKLPIK